MAIESLYSNKRHTYTRTHTHKEEGEKLTWHDTDNMKGHFRPLWFKSFKKYCHLYWGKGLGEIGGSINLLDHLQVKRQDGGEGCLVLMWEYSSRWLFFLPPLMLQDWMPQTLILDLATPFLSSFPILRPTGTGIPCHWNFQSILRQTFQTLLFRCCIQRQGWGSDSTCF